MASLMYTVFSMAQVASLHCSVRREISPCTCAPHEILSNTILVTCESVGSFNQVVDALQNKFHHDLNISLKITYSQLEDLETRSFRDMNMVITNLRLNNDQLRVLPESSFRNLSKIQFLSLADNNLEEIPRHIFKHMPIIATLDLSHGRIRKVLSGDLKILTRSKVLILVNNRIKMIEKDSIPKTIRYLHLGRNNLTSLNGTIQQLTDMEVLFINENEIDSLDHEISADAQKLMMIIAHHNKLKKLPSEFKMLEKLNSLYFSYNELKSLDGVFRHGCYIENLFVDNNKLEYLATDEFQETERMETLDVSYNLIKSLNQSLLPLTNIRSANCSHNLITEFSLDEIRGLKMMKIIDLSYNKIEILTDGKENASDLELFIYELRLEHNLLKSLNGALVELTKLRVLNLSYNLLQNVLATDLIGMEELEILDVSYNNLQTLDDASKTLLPKLETLNASFNNFSRLVKDFHGMPILCLADLSYNRISSISMELVAKTQCNNHGVLNKLEILLQENPILCKDDLSTLSANMESKEARLMGVSNCIVPLNEITITSSNRPKSLHVSNIILNDFPTNVQPAIPALVIVPINKLTSTDSPSNLLKLLSTTNNNTKSSIEDTSAFNSSSLNGTSDDLDTSTHTPIYLDANNTVHINVSLLIPEKDQHPPRILQYENVPLQ